MATATELPDLWGDDIKVDVVSPLVILKIQAEKLNPKDLWSIGGDRGKHDEALG